MQENQEKQLTIKIKLTAEKQIIVDCERSTEMHLHEQLGMIEMAKASILRDINTLWTKRTKVEPTDQ
jgi:hypothetical protein